MPLEFDNVTLSQENFERCENTIGPNTFFMMVVHAVISGRAMSVVRMGDGERILYEYSVKHPDHLITGYATQLSNDWLDSFGCNAIHGQVLADRIRTAAENCTYFAPQIMGMQRPDWAIAELFRKRDRYVDNWFVRQWPRSLHDQLFQAARSVMVIHGDQSVLDRLTSRITGQGATASSFKMTNWRDGVAAIDAACKSNARLVLFSGGPANKHIAPHIAPSGKVVLDIGQALAKEWV